MTSYELTHFWKTKPQIRSTDRFLQAKSITFIFIKMMSLDLLVQMAYCLCGFSSRKVSRRCGLLYVSGKVYHYVNCSTVKDHSYFVEIYLFVSPCFHSDIFLTSGHSHSKHTKRAPFISLHGLLNVGCFCRVGVEVAYFDAIFYPFQKPDN